MLLLILLLVNFLFFKHGYCITNEVCRSRNHFSTRHRALLQIKRRKSISIFSTAVDDHDSIIFAGVKFRPPIATSLRNLNLTDPSPIQKSSLLPLVTGLSCILHAETGSGKTLCYLLPILKRLYDSDLHSSGIRVLIIVPTKELAVQVASDVCNLVGGNSSLVHVCLSASKDGLDSVEAPIVVGTSYKLLQSIRQTSMTVQLFDELDYVVLDEVDRLVPVAGRYARGVEKNAIDERTNPTVELVTYILQLRKGKSEIDSGTNLPFQVVAASATVGRPLRREMQKLFQLNPEFSEGSTKRGSSNSDFHIIRPFQSESSAATRMVGIPSGITHIAVLDSADSVELSTKLAIAKQLWVLRKADRIEGGHHSCRGLLFVPTSNDVSQALGILRFWGVSEATNLLQMLGIDSSSSSSSSSGSDSSESFPGKKVVTATPSTPELLKRAEESGLGSSNPTLKGGMPSTEDTISRDLFVAPVSGSRGLHLQDIDTVEEYKAVLILRPPRTMDEYLHMAGRTGRRRAGTSESTNGTVITVVNLEEMKRLQSWQTPLGITFNVQYA